jgi:hypothetical protein
VNGKCRFGLEVITAALMKSCIFWVIMKCSPLRFNWCFGGTYLYFQHRRINKIVGEQAAGGNQSRAYYFGLVWRSTSLKSLELCSVSPVLKPRSGLKCSLPGAPAQYIVFYTLFSCRRG